MSFNNKIIKGLITAIIILSIILLINGFYWKVPILESFIISFISGAIVSLFITYVQYKKEKIDIIYYYNNIIVEYYELLNNITLILDSNDSEKEKFDTTKLIFNNYLKNHKSNKSIVKLNLILNDIKNKYLQKIYQELYGYSKGVYLLKYFIKPSKKNMLDLKTTCNNQINTIDEGMTILTDVFNIDYPWKEYKKIVTFEK